MTCGTLYLLAGKLTQYMGMDSVASGAKRSLFAGGGVSCPALGSDTFSIGDTVYWDNTNARLTSTSSGNTNVGFAMEAKASGVATILVYLYD